VSWGSQLTGPLFDPSIHWVPGDVRTRSFFVRNDGATAASLRVEGRDAVTGELTDDHAVALFARADAGRWLPLPVGGLSARLNTVALPVGGVSRVDVRAVFDPAADNHSQEERAELTFVVALQDAGVAEGPTGQPTGHATGHGTGHLPGTGAPEITVPLAAAAGLVGAGVALVGRRRVRRG
jgi:hypothetical protein